MALVKEMYSASRINLIYQLLKNEAENDTPKEYDIKVDDLKVVSRNSDPERFHSHEEFVLPESRNITINIYDSKSHRCTRYLLLLKEEDPTKQELSGIEKSIDAKMVQERKNWEYDQLKKEYNDLKQKLEESEEYADTLKDRVDQLEAEKNTRSTKITETIIGFAGAYLASKPNALNGIPLLGDLLGGGHNKHVNTSDEANEERECAFAYEKKNAKTFTGELTEIDEQELKIALIPFFEPGYIERVGQIIQYLHLHNPFIDQTIQVIEHAINQAQQPPKTD